MKNIFVLEDDKHIQKVIYEYLSDFGYCTTIANDGLEALKLIEETTSIDLFILDIMVPHISGVEILSRIRNIEIYKNTPIIMLTAMSDEYTQINCFDKLADDYIIKPFSPKVLVKKVQSMLRRTTNSYDVLQYGDITINFDSHEIFENNNEIILTSTEFNILTALIVNKGKVLSRLQLITKIKGYDDFVDERVIDAHIKNIRKKLNNNIIITVKGVGYKVIDM